VDSAPFVIVLIVVVAAVIGGIAALNAHRQRKRFQEYAAQRGWDYTPSEHSLARSFPQVDPFGSGSSRRCTNVLRYRVGEYSGCSFDYSFTVSRGSGTNRSSTTYRFHVVSFDLPHPLPRLTLRPEGMFDGVAKFFGSQDVQFESEEFNRAWFVQSEHLPAAHDLIHPRMMGWLLEPAQRGASFVIEDGILFTFLKGRQNLENVDPLIDRLAGLFGHVPEFVWQKAQGEYPRPERGGGFFGIFG